MPDETPPSFTVEDLPTFRDNEEFMAKSVEDRAKVMNYAIGSAYADIQNSGGFSQDEAQAKEQYKSFRKLSDEARFSVSSSIAEDQTWALQAIPKAALGVVKDIGAAVGGFIMGSGADADNGPNVVPNEIAKTQAEALANAVTGRGSAYQQMLYEHLPAGRAVNDELEKIKAGIDDGDLVANPPKFLTEASAAIQSKLPAYLGIEPTDPTLAGRGLNDPKAAMALNLYAATGDESAWKDFRSEVFKTDWTKQTDADKAAMLESPGAKQFEAVFGKGAAEHLVSGSDPVMIAAMAVPVLRGAGAAEATIGGVAKTVAEQAAFGVDAAVRDNPDLTAMDAATSAGKMIALGTALHGAGWLAKQVVGGAKPAADSVEGDLHAAPPVDQGLDAMLAQADAEKAAKEIASPPPAAPPVVEKAPAIGEPPKEAPTPETFSAPPPADPAAPPTPEIAKVQEADSAILHDAASHGLILAGGPKADEATITENALTLNAATKENAASITAQVDMMVDPTKPTKSAVFIDEAKPEAEAPIMAAVEAAKEKHSQPGEYGYTEVPGGAVVFDKAVHTEAEIQQMAADGTLGEALGYGVASKPDFVTPEARDQMVADEKAGVTGTDLQKQTAAAKTIILESADGHTELAAVVTDGSPEQVAKVTESLQKLQGEGDKITEVPAEKMPEVIAKREADKAALDEALQRKKAALEASAATPPERLTSIKNAQTAADLRENSLPPAMQELRTTNQESFDAATAKMAADPKALPDLLKRLQDDPTTPVTHIENMMLLRRWNELQIESRAHGVEWAKAVADGDTAKQAVLKSDQARLIRENLELSRVLRDTGTVTAQALQSRKVMIREDYTLAPMLSGLEESKGEGLTEGEKEHWAGKAADHAANEDLIAKLNKSTEENQALAAKNAALQDLLEKAKADAAKEAKPAKEPADAKAPKKPVGADFIAKSAAKRAEIAKEIRAMLGRTNIGADPLIAAKAAEYMGHLIAEGTVKFAQIAVKMKDDLGELIDGLDLKAMYDSAKAHAKSLVANAARDIAGEKTAILEGIKKRITEGDTKPELHRFARELAKRFIDEGVHGLEALDTAVHDALKTVIPEITKVESGEAWSGYGQWKPLDLKPEKVILRERSAERQKLATLARLQTKLEGLQKNPPEVLPGGLKTGGERQAPTERARGDLKAIAKLSKQIDQISTSLGLKSGTDSARQLKSTLDGIKSRLRNEVADMDFAMSTGKRIAKDKSGTTLDKEAQDLKDARDAKKKIYDAVFPKEPISDAEALRRAIIVEEANLKSWNEKLDNAKKGIFSKREAPQAWTRNERETQIKAEVDAAKAQIAHLRDVDSVHQEKLAQEKLQKTGDALEARLRDGETKAENDPALGPDSAEVTALKARNDELRAQIAAAKDGEAGVTARLEKSIKSISDELASGELKEKIGKATRPDTEKNARLRDELKSLQEFKAEIKRAQTPRKSDAEIRLGAQLAGAARRYARLNERIANQDFAPTAKKGPPVAATPKERQMEADLKAARLRNQKIERDYNTAKAKYELENEPAWRKVSRGAGRFSRIAVLSSMKIYTKLAMLGWIVKPFATLLEETLGATGARALLPGTMRNAAGEGANRSLVARAADYGRGYRRGFAEMNHVRREGQTTNQALHSDQGKFDSIPNWEDKWIAHPHMMLKAPAWEAAFSLSEGNRIDHAGYSSISEVPPEELANLQKEAAKDADHHIAINENVMNKAFSNTLSAWERSGAGGQIAADLLRMDAPIRKIPTNIAAGSMKYMFGSVMAPIKIAFKAHAGELTPEVYNDVARTMKKGMTFASLVTLAALVPGAIKVGGLYVRDDKKRKPDDLKPGEMEILGVKIPEGVGHSDVGASAQAMGTAIRAFHDSQTKGHGNTVASLYGLTQAVLGTAQDLPSVKIARDVGGAVAAGEGAAGAASRLAKNLIPVPVKFAAEQQDYTGDQSVLRQLLMGSDKENVIYRGQSFTSGIPDVGQSAIGLGSRQDLTADMRGKETKAVVQRLGELERIGATRKTNSGEIIKGRDKGQEAEYKTLLQFHSKYYSGTSKNPGLYDVLTVYNKSLEAGHKEVSAKLKPQAEMAAKMLEQKATEALQKASDAADSERNPRKPLHTTSRDRSEFRANFPDATAVMPAPPKKKIRIPASAGGGF